MTTRMEGAYAAIEIAQRKEAEGNLRRAHMAYEAAITDFMHLAFAECAGAEDVRRWLSGHPFDLAAHRFRELAEEILAMPEAEWARYFESGNYLLVAFSHVFAAVGQNDQARFFARTAAEPALFGTPFWAEYAKTLWAMMQGRHYAPVLGKLNRAERFWSCYVDLMQAGMNQKGIDVEIQEVDRQFAMRNCDPNIHEDPYMIDGTGHAPLAFDFRKVGLLHAMKAADRL